MLFLALATTSSNDQASLLPTERLGFSKVSFGSVGAALQPACGVNPARMLVSRYH